MNCGNIIAIPLIDIQIIEDLKVALTENNFSVSLNLIQTYKSLSISKYVFGITSYALLLSSYLKIKTFDCIKPSQKIRSLPSKNINSFYKLLAD